MPPLRERVADLIPLAEYFLKQHSAQARLSADAAAALKKYHWPGNVRQLRNAMAHAVVTARGYEVGAADLPRLAPAPTAPEGSLTLDGLEREAICQALDRTGGHHQRAAGLLGISRRTLSRKLKLYRLESNEEVVHVR